MIFVAISFWIKSSFFNAGSECVYFIKFWISLLFKYSFLVLWIFFVQLKPFEWIRWIYLFIWNLVFKSFNQHFFEDRIRIASYSRDKRRIFNNTFFNLFILKNYLLFIRIQFRKYNFWFSYKFIFIYNLIIFFYFIEQRFQNYYYFKW